MHIVPTIVNFLGGAVLFFAYKMIDYKTKQKNVGRF